MSAIGNVDPNRIQLNRQARAAYEAEQARRAEVAKLEALEAARAEQLKKEAEERNRRDLERSAARHRQNIFLGPKGWEFIITPTYEDPFGERAVTRSEVNPAYFNTPEGKELEKQFQAAEQKAVDKAITDYIAQAKSQGILAKDIKAWYDEKTGMVHVQGSNFEPLKTQVQAQAIAGQPQTTYQLKVPSRSDYKTDAEYQQAQKQYSEAQTKLSYEALQNVTRQLQQAGGGTVTQELLKQEQSRLLATKYREGVPVVSEAQKQAQADYLNKFYGYISQGYVPHYEGDKVTFTKPSEAKNASIDRGTARLNEILHMRELGYGAPVPIFENGKRVGTAYQPLAGRQQYELRHTDPMNPWKFEKVPISSTGQQQQQFNPNIAEQAWRISVGLGGQTAAGAADLMAFIVGKNAPVNKQISSGLESFAQATRAATGLEGLSKVYETLGSITGSKQYAYAALQAKSQSQAEVPVIDPISAAAGGIAALAGSAEGKRVVDAFIEQTQKRPLETAITSLFDFYMVGGSRLTRANIESSIAKVRNAESNIASKILKAEPIKKAYAEELKPAGSPPPAEPSKIAASPGGFKNVTIDLGTGVGEIKTIPTVPFDTFSTAKPDKTTATSKPDQLKDFKESSSGEGQTLLTIQKSEVTPLTSEQLTALQKELDEIKMFEQKEVEAAKLRELLRKAEKNEEKIANNILSAPTSQALGLYGQTGLERILQKRKTKIEEIHEQQQYRLPGELAGKENITFAETMRSQSNIILPKIDTEKALNEMTKLDGLQRQAQAPQAATDIMLGRVSATNQNQMRMIDHAQQVREAFKEIEQAMTKLGHAQRHDQQFAFKMSNPAAARTKQEHYRETSRMTATPAPPKLLNYYFGTKKRKKGINYQERLWHLGKVEDLLFTGKYTEEPFWNW